MRTFRDPWKPEGIAKWLHIQAAKGAFDGLKQQRNFDYLETCKAYHAATGALALLARDIGHHTSGYWKNPDYERCLHLSLSWKDPETRKPRDFDKKAAREWVDAVFGQWTRLLWIEPPFSKLGHENEVWHYRLFYADRAFTVPLLPRGEVYTKEFTEAGWLSFSDARAAEEAEAEREVEVLGNL